MKQRMTALLLLLLMLVPAAGAAGTEVSDDGHRYDNVSPWAVEGVTEALDLGLAIWPSHEDAKTAIYRRDFAENAAALVALAYGTDLSAYENYANLAAQRDGTAYQYAYETLHIL